MRLFAILSIIFLSLGISMTTNAQATRTWVSGVGDDVNPCSRTAPCKTFAGAISKTAAGGEINCLDPGGFGTVSITKSITLDCTNAFGSILASGTTGVIVNSATAIVRLRGLQINGAGTGTMGVRVVAASKVYVENSLIDGFTGHGVNVETPGAGSPPQVFVTNTTIRNNGGSGINGVPTGATEVVVSNCFIAGNLTGVLAQANAVIRISGNTIVGNITGLRAFAPRGQIISFQNNSIDGNLDNGSATSTVPLR